MKTYLVTISSSTNPHVGEVSFTMRSESSREYLKAVLKRDLAKQDIVVCSVYALASTDRKNPLTMKEAVFTLNKKVSKADTPQQKVDRLAISNLFNHLLKSSKLTYIEA